MIKRRLIISSVISIFLVSILLIGSTYSIFTSQEIDETANVYKTGNLNVTYKVSSNTVHFTDPTPMTIEEADAVIPYRITVTNTGNVAYEFDVILMDTTASEENTIDYQYIMTKVGYLDPKLLSDCTNNIIKENVIVPAGKSVDIDIRLWLDSTLPNTEMGNSFYAKLKIDGLAVYNDNEEIDNSSLSLRYMNTSSTNDFRNDAYRTYITTASFVDYIDTSNASVNTETNEKIMWDMSTSQDKSVIAWLEDNGELDENGNKLYDLYIGSKEKIYAKNLASFNEGFFKNMINLENLNFNNLSTSLTISMLSMFEGCSSLTSLDLSSFDTSNVTKMNTTGYFSYGGMFMGCGSLKFLNLSSFDTSKVESFGNMFHGCSSLTSLDLSSFDTTNATDMGSMFNGCNSLLELNLNNFDTNRVTNMSSMFKNCSSFVELDLSNFDTYMVTNMSSMYQNCTNLMELDVSNFGINNATNLSFMFYHCSSLIELDLNNFGISKVTTMNSMFDGCSNLAKLDFSNFDASSVTTMMNLFSGCLSLTGTNLSRWNVSNVTKMNYIFYNCNSLIELDLSNWDTSSLVEAPGMFWGCYKLSTTLTIRNNSTTYTNMFHVATTAEGAQIIVNYIGDDPSTTDINESTEELVDAMIATKSTNSNVVKGELVV